MWSDMCGASDSTSAIDLLNAVTNCIQTVLLTIGGFWLQSLKAKAVRPPFSRTRRGER